MADYSAKDVKVLSEIEHIQTNSEMYIGSTENPSHLVEEAIDNGITLILPLKLLGNLLGKFKN